MATNNNGGFSNSFMSKFEKYFDRENERYYDSRSLNEKLNDLMEILQDIEENKDSSIDKSDLEEIKQELRFAKQNIESAEKSEQNIFKERGISSDWIQKLEEYEFERQKLLKDQLTLQKDLDSGKVDADSEEVVRARIKQFDKALKARKKAFDASVTNNADLSAKEKSAIKKVRKEVDANKSEINSIVEKKREAKEFLDVQKRNLEMLRQYEREVDKTARKYEERLQKYKSIVNDIAVVLKKPLDKWLEIEKASKESAKAIGLNREQTIAYQKAISRTAKELARTYGLSFEQSAKLQDMYNNATDRSAILSENEMRNVAAMSTLVGEDTTRTVIENMDKLGGGVEAATVAIGKANLKAKAMGLNIVTASSAFAKNMSMANKYSFKNGVDGVMRMTMLSQKLKFNLESMGGVIDKFTNISDAIETSANLQMMGGEAAMLFGNPLENLYQGLNDPEALIEKATKMFASRAVFNRQTGEAELKSYNLQWVRNTAQMLGMNPDEAAQMARQSAKIQAIDAEMTNSAKGNQRVRDIIESIAKFDVAQQKHYVTYLDESGQRQRVDVSAINANNKELIDQIAAQEEPVEDIQSHVRKLAETLTSIDSKIKGAEEAYSIATAEVVENTGIGDLLRNMFQGKDSIPNKIYESLMNIFTNGSWGTGINMLIGALGTTFIGNLAKGKSLRWFAKKNVDKPALEQSQEIETLTNQKGSRGGGTRGSGTRGGGTNGGGGARNSARPRLAQRNGWQNNSYQQLNGRYYRIDENGISTRIGKTEYNDAVQGQAQGGQRGGQRGGNTRTSSTAQPRATSRVTAFKRLQRMKFGKALGAMSKVGKYAKFAGKVAGPLAAIYGIVEGGVDLYKAYSQGKQKEAEIEANTNLTAQQKSALKDANVANTSNNKTKAVTGGVGAFAGGLAGAKIGAIAGGLIGGPIGAAIGGFVGGVGGAIAGSGIGKGLVGSDNRTDTDILQEDFETQKFGMDAIAKSLQVDPSGENLKLLAAQATIKMNDVLVSIWNKMNGKQSNGAVEQKGFIDNVADKGITAAIGGVFKNLFASDKEKESKTHYFGAFKGEGDIDGGNGNKSISIPQNSAIGNDIRQEGKNAGIATVNSDEVVMHREKIVNLGNAFNDLASTTNAISNVNVRRNGNTVFDGDYSNSIATFKGDKSTFVTTNGISQQYSLAPVNQKPVEANFVTPMYSQPNFSVQPPQFGPEKLDLNINLTGSIDLKSDGIYSGNKLDADKLMKDQPYFMDRLTYIIMENITRKMHGGQRFGQTKM